MLRGRHPLTVVAVVLALLCLPPSLVLFATWPAHQDAVITVQDATATPHEFQLWRAEPLVSLPFFDTPHAWVRYQGRTFRLHGNDYGAWSGDLFVSPDRSQVAITSRFEGARRVRFVIDLGDGQAHKVHRWAKDYEAAGWQRIPWGKEW